MAEISITPDVGALEIPTDAWTQPFWDAAFEERIVLPHCTACGTYRWPPGPFCPECSAQEVAWTQSGPGRVYSYTVVRRPVADPERPPQVIVPALIEFAEAGGVRILAALVDAPVEDIRVGAPVRAHFSRAANGNIPVFTLDAEDEA
jgi:uncharacterized OB-fold protein